MFPILRVRAFAMTLGAVVALASVANSAEPQDVPPVDVAQLLQTLRSIKEQQAQQLKANKQKALQDVQAAAASPSAAAAAWEEAVRQVQFEGGSREGAQFREWKEKEGRALTEKEAQSAARLFFQWLALTLQRSNGIPVKDLLPQIIQHTKEVTADLAAAEALEERIKREKELAASGKHAKGRQREDELVKRVHDQILNRAVSGSPPAQALNIGELVGVAGWEQNPGSVEGIFQTIILPELRAAKDPRILEYWDMRIKREGEAAAKVKLAFDAEKFTQIRRPELLWGRAEEFVILGNRNRAISEMFAVLKAYPAHPQAVTWVGRLEKMLAAPSPAVSASEAAPRSSPTGAGAAR